MNKSKVENGEVKNKSNNEGLIEQEIKYLLFEYKESGDDSRIANVLEAVQHALNQHELEVAKKISSAAQEAGLVPNELTSGKDWKKAVDNALNQQRKEGAREAYKMFLGELKKAKEHFPGRKEFIVEIDIRKVEKLLKFLTKLEGEGNV